MDSRNHPGVGNIELKDVLIKMKWKPFLIIFVYLLWIVFESEEDCVDEDEPSNHPQNHQTITKCWFIQIQHLACSIRVVNNDEYMKIIVLSCLDQSRVVQRGREPRTWWCSCRWRWSTWCCSPVSAWLWSFWFKNYLKIILIYSPTWWQCNPWPGEAAEAGRQFHQQTLELFLWV